MSTSSIDNSNLSSLTYFLKQFVYKNNATGIYKICDYTAFSITLLKKRPLDIGIWKSCLFLKLTVVAFFISLERKLLSVGCKSRLQTRPLTVSDGGLHTKKGRTVLTLRLVRTHPSYFVRFRIWLPDLHFECKWF